jgi:hypothetical protein
MLNIDSIKIKELLDSSIQDTNLRKKILSLALGISVARVSQLPTGSVESISEYYSESVVASINDSVYSFNEQLVVDVTYASSVAKAYYMVRYNNTYPDFSIALITSENFDYFGKISGVDRYISLDDYTLANENKLLLLNLTNQICNLLNR